MKTKPLIIVSIAIAIIGILFGVVGMSMLGWNFMSLDTDKYEVKQHVIDVDASNLTDIVLNVKSSDFKMIETDEDKITVDYKENTRAPFTITYDNGALNINEKALPIRLFSFFNGLKSIDSEVVVTYPRGLILNVKGKISNGSITQSGKFKNFDVLSNNGAFNLTEFTADSLKIGTTNGKIILKDVNVIGDLTASNTNGAITIKNTIAANINSKSTNGEITIEKATAKDVVSKTTNGSVSFTDIISENIVVAENTNGAVSLVNVSGKDLIAKTTNGKINFTNIVADKINLRTTNGNIAGSIIGRIADYTIEVSVTAGKSNLNNQTGTGKELFAKTTSGDIVIEFIA